MPFTYPLQPFTRASLEQLNPNQLGCYGIFAGNVCVYVGKGDIRARLLDHLNGDNPRITRRNPTHWTAMVTAAYDSKEKELIREYDPPANQRVG
jgi:hypothetical protein